MKLRYISVFTHVCKRFGKAEIYCHFKCLAVKFPYSNIYIEKLIQSYYIYKYVDRMELN